MLVSSIPFPLVVTCRGSGPRQESEPERLAQGQGAGPVRNRHSVHGLTTPGGLHIPLHRRALTSNQIPGGGGRLAMVITVPSPPPRDTPGLRPARPVIPPPPKCRRRDDPKSTRPPVPPPSTPPMIRRCVGEELRCRDVPNHRRPHGRDGRRRLVDASRVAEGRGHRRYDRRLWEGSSARAAATDVAVMRRCPRTCGLPLAVSMRDHAIVEPMLVLSSG